MSSKILLKKSSVSGKFPATPDLAYGELALNYSDERIYFKNSSNVIKSFNTTTNYEDVLFRPITSCIRTFYFENTMEWVIVHNMGSRSFVSRITDRNGNTIFASTSIIDDSSFVINLTSAVSGQIDVIFNSPL